MSDAAGKLTSKAPANVPFIDLKRSLQGLSSDILADWTQILNNTEFVGGPIGSGKHYMSWIHNEDEVGLILFAIDHAESVEVTAVGRLQLGDERWPPAGREAGRVVKRAQAGETGVDDPEFGLRSLRLPVRPDG